MFLAASISLSLMGYRHISGFDVMPLCLTALFPLPLRRPSRNGKRRRQSAMQRCRTPWAVLRLDVRPALSLLLPLSPLEMASESVA
jgi:hypothetical protein